MKLIAGSNSAMGSFDSPARKITCSYPAKSSTLQRRMSSVYDRDAVREIDAEPLQIDDLDVVAALQQSRDERRPDVTGTADDEDLHAALSETVLTVSRALKYVTERLLHVGIRSRSMSASAALTRYVFSAARSSTGEWCLGTATRHEPAPLSSTIRRAKSNQLVSPWRAHVVEAVAFRCGGVRPCSRPELRVDVGAIRY